MADAHEQEEELIRRELGSLALSCVRTENGSLHLRALRWHNMLLRLGVEIPFFAVQDVGLLFAASPAALEIDVPPWSKQIDADGVLHSALSTWTSALKAISQTEIAEKARAWKLSDEMIAVLLMRTLGPVADRLPRSRRKARSTLPLDAALVSRVLAEPTKYFDGAASSRFVSALAASPLRITLAFEQIDHDTLRMLGSIAKEGGRADALGVLDLFEVLATPEANDVVNFSLDLLPSVLETKRASGQQSFSVDGYAGLQRKGTLDSLMLTELAFDEDLFNQRFLENELFYYAREKQNENEGVLHYICVDASASMRGQRATFARGLALTLAKKLILRGENVLFRFFDGRLYDPLIVDGSRPTKNQRGLDIPYILGFKGEHGRNYTHVFELLSQDVARRAKRDGQTPVVYLITHSECHAPMTYVQRLADVAQLYGIFVMPSSGALDLEYLPLLKQTQVVDEAMLNDKKTRAKRALDIVGDATERKVAPGAHR